MLSDVYVRTSGGVSRLFTGLSGVYNGGRKHLLAGLDPAVMRGDDIGQRASTLELLLKHTLCAFRSRPLPALEERLREAALQSLGLRGRAGISLYGLYRRLAATLPPAEAAPFAGVDWEALASGIARRVAAGANRRLVQAYERLRELTERYSFLLDASGHLNPVALYSPAFPAEMPLEDRFRHVMLAAMESFKSMEQVLTLRKPLADALRSALHEAIYPMVGKAGMILPPYFAEDTPFARELAAWEASEAEADCAAFLAEFDERLAASGKSWGIWDKYSFHVRFMLTGFDISSRLTAGFRAQLELAAAYIAERRVPQ